MTVQQFIERLLLLLDLWLSKIEDTGDECRVIRTSLRALVDITGKIRPALAPFYGAETAEVEDLTVLAFLVSCHAKLNRLGPRILELCCDAGADEFDALMHASEIACARVELQMQVMKTPPVPDPDDNDRGWRVRHGDDLRELQLAYGQLGRAKFKTADCSRELLTDKIRAAMADSERRQFCFSYDNFCPLVEQILEDLRFDDSPASVIQNLASLLPANVPFQQSLIAPGLMVLSACIGDVLEEPEEGAFWQARLSAVYDRLFPRRKG